MDDIEQLRKDAKRWRTVRDGSYELLHNLTETPSQFREAVIDQYVEPEDEEA